MCWALGMVTNGPFKIIIGRSGRPTRILILDNMYLQNVGYLVKNTNTVRLGSGLSQQLDRLN